MNFFLSFISIALTLLLLSNFYLSYKKKVINLFEMAVILIIFSFVIFVSLRPSSVDKIFYSVLGYSFKDFVNIISIIILFYLSFLNYSKIKDLDKKINQLIRLESLKEIKNKYDDFK
ncbi:hypothetical protein HIMB59_00015110 [alpha proteobacterium HIMB59]|nr:hypothetical protein HIMB59_00015110 [alpha proteobacterium HIMB59]